MNKIPVGKTIASAYQFVFEHLGTIIGLIWLPTLLIGIGGFFAETYYGSTIVSAMQEGRPAAAGQAVLSLFGWYSVSLLLGAMICTVVTQQALGLRKGPAWFHFALGLPEFRVFGAEVALFALLIIFVFVYLTFVSGAEALGAAAALAVALAGAAAMMFAAVRLGFLVVPATVADGAIGLSRSWLLTQGNFWRIAGVMAATIGPVMVALGVGEYFILGPHYFELGLTQNPNPAAQTAAMAEQSKIILQHLPMIFGLWLLLAPFYFGLLLAPAAFAFRALTAPPQSAI